MKNVLIVSSVASMIDQFNIPNILLLQKMGANVTVACNFKDGNSCTEERIKKLTEYLTEINVKYFQVDFTRHMGDIKSHVKAYKQLKNIIKSDDFAFVHCHSPIGGAIARLVGHSVHIPVIYTAHGFHFFKGSSIKNWILFYPVEKILSYVTDTLITINRTDFDLAKRKFHAGTIEYLPGVGIDLARFHKDSIDHEKNDDFVMLSVGELNANKNHIVVLKALKKLKDENKIPTNLKYFICGQGLLHDELMDYIKDNNLDEYVELLGFCENIDKYYSASDVFVFPSFREGLSVSLMEAMASGLPVICSNIRGNIDLIDNQGGYLFNPGDADELSCLLYDMWKDPLRAKKGEYNSNRIKDFSVEEVMERTEEIYSKLL